MAGPLLGMIKQASGGMVAGQVGAGLGALAGEVLGACEIGIPLGAPGRAALVPANVAEFAADRSGGHLVEHAVGAPTIRNVAAFVKQGSQQSDE